MNRLLPLREVLHRTGFKKSKTYALISEGRHPKPIKLGTSSRWIEGEVETFVEDQITRSRDREAAP